MFNDFNLGNVKCPCYHCKDRTMVCDSTCKRYRDYKIKVKEYREKQHIQNILGNKGE